MRNQFGQEIGVGDWVGYASKTGSVTTRKIGRVVRFGERKNWNEVLHVAYVNWLKDGTWGSVRDVKSNGSGVAIQHLFKLDRDGLEP